MNCFESNSYKYILTCGKHVHPSMATPLILPLHMPITQLQAGSVRIYFNIPTCLRMSLKDMSSCSPAMKLFSPLICSVYSLMLRGEREGERGSKEEGMTLVMFRI